MLLEIQQLLFSRHVSPFSSIPFTYHILVFSFGFLAISLFLWRLWTFTVLPSLRSSEPKELPYWVPCK